MGNLSTSIVEEGGRVTFALNPVERHLINLGDSWLEFKADASKRLLLWQTPDNATRILQCFFELQKHESQYSTNDLFIVFNAGFENSIQYSRALKEELAGQYEASKEDLKQQGIAADWEFKPEVLPDSPSGFIQSLRLFGSKYHKVIGHLVAVLMPQSVENDRAFISWLERVMQTGIPERLRLVVIDSTEYPRFGKLIDSSNPLVYNDTLKVDTLAIAQETFAQEVTTGPAGVFRNYLMGLVTLIEKGSLEQVKAKAIDAFIFARKQKWSDQEVAIRMLYAGALLKEKHFGAAQKIYQGARQSAVQAMESDHPAGRQLVLQTWFGEASADFASGDIVHAAECYDQAAIVARQIPNPVLEIEAYRMTAFCHARLAQRDAALERSLKVFACAKQLKPEARPITTMPLAAIDLLRIIDPERVQLMEDIKYRFIAAIEKANEVLEQQAEELDKAQDTQQLHIAEETLKLNKERAKREAEYALDEVVRAGSEQFQDIFSQARELLNKEWPLATLAAVQLPSELQNQGMIAQGEALS
ncbi:hypothetical protein [Nitrosomonas communis]|uniref:Uncharacterized protein n=1 Tax=Nitrosomonas communis TaxID=44574 RepID=A0A1H2V4H1_9PROT|nr:hypothetical protein [Nitrosomonas communis]SDW62854.1 hypothetical protein SAMN05421882_101937 [Nitrosomonas communis]